MATNSKPTEDHVRQIIINSEVPLVFRGLIDSWSLTKFSQEDWDCHLPSELQCRVGQRFSNGEPQWERQCDKIKCSYSDLIQWTKNNQQNAALKDYQPQDHFLYFDYKYMNSIFNTTILQAVNWSWAGYTGRDGRESTFWLGTEGAYTPCHYDTYGFNLVAQILGKKKWILYPPEVSKLLRPTRIPYEESSIYSSVDFTSKDQVSELPSARVIVLEPGDVLFIPRHWWHFVQNLELSISINTWLEHPLDPKVRLEESLVKFFMANVSRNIPPTISDLLLNPNEDETATIPLSQAELYIEQSLCSLKPEDSHEATAESIDLLLEQYSDFISIVPLAAEGRRSKKMKMKMTPENPDLFFRIVNAFCHPQVIQMVCQILRDGK